MFSIAFKIGGDTRGFFDVDSRANIKVVRSPAYFDKSYLVLFKEEIVEFLKKNKYDAEVVERPKYKH
tara:strand:+ start:52 stop:252 length:201 start_codon:yes stop_codon:yes gene_type:complete